MDELSSRPAMRNMASPPPHVPVQGAMGLIEIRNFSLNYVARTGDVAAVRDVSLTVRPGEFISIIGPSGCGKSTLLSAVAGFLKPSAGQVMVDGEIISGTSAERGMVFQHYSLFPWKTVRQNVEFGLKMKGMLAHARTLVAQRLLKLTGLEPFETSYPHQLSGGMRQRVGIVRALAPGPKILLLDEPFGALDAQTRQIMQQILLNIWQGLGISVLFVTHDIDEAIFLSDRIYVMTSRPGTLKAEIAVDLPRPRDPAIMVAPEFISLRAQLMALLRAESIKAMGGEVTQAAISGATNLNSTEG
ncbi:MAG TPA: ABC transporter ATP-binding protein [Acetobacteraceae bacterium]|nr:ABC transporter ATP-binding protein [Acetobacteraceae bacterium]HQU01418.1 ABC transporter ATP-binding protein [Acetobacteraceae bacterium]